MSSKVRVVISLGLAGALMVSAMGLAMAQSTTKTLSTNFTLVNFGAAQANVNASYVKDDGTAWHTTAFTITAGGQKIVRQYVANSDSPTAAGKGSLVLQSDQGLGAVVQILASYPGGPAQLPTSGAYAGFGSGAASFNVPLIGRKGASASGQQNSQIMVQNTGAASTVASISLTAFAGSTGSKTITKTLASGQTWYFDLNSDLTDAEFGTSWFGSASVTAGVGGSVAVVANTFAGADTLQTYNGFASGGTTLFAPSVFARLANGLSTPVTIQNISAGTIATGTASLICTGDSANTATPANFTLTNTAQIAAGASFAWNPVTNQSFPTAWFGSCKVSSPASVVSFVQIRTVGGTGNQADAAAYEAVTNAGTDKTVVIPLMAKNLANGFTTVATIQNLSNAANTVTIEYIPSAGFTQTLSFTATIGAEGSLIQNLRSGAGVNNYANLPAGWVGSVKVTGQGALNGFVQLRNTLQTAGDNFMAHGVFTQP